MDDGSDSNQWVSMNRKSETRLAAILVRRKDAEQKRLAAELQAAEEARREAERKEKIEATWSDSLKPSIETSIAELNLRLAVEGLELYFFQDQPRHPDIDAFRIHLSRNGTKKADADFMTVTVDEDGAISGEIGAHGRDGSCEWTVEELEENGFELALLDFLDAVV